MKSIIPCFHPTTTVLIDDNNDFLEDLVQLLKLEDKPHQTFCDPRQGVTYINENTYAQKLADKLGHNINPDDVLDLRPEKDILAEMSDPLRYHQPSVLIVDYEMPGMNGLEVCEAIDNPFIKKIMLTGVADERVAIQAFNKGLIYQYIQKQDPVFIEHLQKALRKAQEDYFQDLFRIALQIMKEDYILTPLYEPSFVTYFEDLLKTHKIEQYYLIYPTGNFLMISQDHQLYCLITLEDSMLEEYLDMFPDGFLTAKQVEAIKRRELMPCYYDPFCKPNFLPSNLDVSFCKPTRFKGKTEIFYSVFGQGFIPIDLQSIAFYQPGELDTKPKA